MEINKIKDISFRGKTIKDIGYKSWAFRWVAIILTKLFMHTPITPNQVSIASMLMIIIAAYFLGLGTVFYGLFAAFILYFSEILDYVDGTLARCKNIPTKMQAYFVCSVYHEGAVSFLFVGIGVGAYMSAAQITLIFLGFIAGFFHLFTVYLLNVRGFVLAKLTNVLKVGKDKSDNPELFIKSRISKYLFWLSIFPVSYIKFIILLFVILQKTEWLIMFYSIFLPLRAIAFFIHSYKLIGRLQKKND